MGVVRTQVYLREEQHEFLREEAHRRRVSIAELVRQILDQFVASRGDMGRPAAESAAIGAAPKEGGARYVKPTVKVFRPGPVAEGIRPTLALSLPEFPSMVAAGEDVAITVQITPAPPVGTILTMLARMEGKSPTTLFAPSNSSGMATFHLTPSEPGLLRVDVTFADAEVMGVPTRGTGCQLELEVQPRGQEAGGEGSSATVARQ